MNQLFTIFGGFTIFCEIDLHGAYNLLGIKEGNEHLTAFTAKYGSSEYLVMPFGPTNSPDSFKNPLNDIFADFLYIFVVVYLDYIMVSSSSEEKHVNHVACVLQRLRENNLFSKAPSVYSIPQVWNDWAMFFQVIASRWILRKLFQKITALTSLLKDNSPFIFNEEALSQFQILKEAFTTSPLISHFNPSQTAIVEMDASYYALGAVLSQFNDSGKHPISFYSCKPLPAELNYEINHKELLGIVWALKHRRSFLLCLSDPFEV
ncbi:hypothetical protein O181_035044 [Austropuccinia psidii MF-1]|uniref:Reverse transcriptase/retrotransposon-derived protein RNase H-like domain-containing protein n=1 Tax=Austropuccinia psidii MF-1 TaxID=1389203 RepID=A0A9Q3D201_9BASI|nr:hypothetical protein [Austropuccinia psidii MF-1]